MVILCHTVVIQLFPIISFLRNFIYLIFCVTIISCLRHFVLRSLLFNNLFNLALSIFFLNLVFSILSIFLHNPINLAFPIYSILFFSILSIFFSQSYFLIFSIFFLFCSKQMHNHRLHLEYYFDLH